MCFLNLAKIVIFVYCKTIFIILPAKLYIHDPQARLLLIHDTLSEDITDITRVWPLQLKTKDSRSGEKYFCSNDTDNLPPDCGGSCRRRGRSASCGGSTTRSSPTTTRRSCTGTDKICSGSPNIFTVKIFIPSTGKGISHTLARRAAFFLSQGEHSLAVRDLNIALEYGGQGGCVVLTQLIICLTIVL